MMNGSLVIGKQTDASAGALIHLAARLVDHARLQGMTLASIRRSKQRASMSCYLALHDSHKRLWIVRVSNHLRPLVSPFPKPHFDLVSVDGVSGFSQACGTIDAMADGTMPWHDAELTVRMPRSMKRSRR